MGLPLSGSVNCVMLLARARGMIQTATARYRAARACFARVVNSSPVVRVHAVRFRLGL